MESLQYIVHPKTQQPRYCDMNFGDIAPVAVVHLLMTYPSPIYGGPRPILGGVTAMFPLLLCIPVSSFVPQFVFHPHRFVQDPFRMTNTCFQRTRYAVDYAVTIHLCTVTQPSYMEQSIAQGNTAFCVVQKFLSFRI